MDGVIMKSVRDLKMNHYKSLFFLLLLFLLSCKNKNDKYSVIVNNVEGLEEGSLVTYKGLPVGKVVSMNFYNDSIIVDFEVAKDFKIPSGSKCIVTNNILTHLTLAIEPGRNKSFISINDTLRGYKDTSQFSFFGTDTAKQNNKKKSIRKIAEGFKELFEEPADSIKK
jgi:ABC-type transporter Mla subunit MlaD